MKVCLEDRGVVEIMLNQDLGDGSAFTRMTFALDSFVKDVFTVRFDHDFEAMSEFTGHLYFPKSNMTVFVSKSMSATSDPRNPSWMWFGQRWYVMSGFGLFAAVDYMFNSVPNRAFLNDFRLYRALRGEWRKSNSLGSSDIYGEIADFIDAVEESC